MDGEQLSRGQHVVQGDKVGLLHNGVDGFHARRQNLEHVLVFARAVLQTIDDVAVSRGAARGGDERGKGTGQNPQNLFNARAICAHAL